MLAQREIVKSKIDIYVIDRVKEKRIEKNLSQAALAYELGMSVGFIGKVESSKYSSHYNIKHINDLARILKCSPQDFLPHKPI
ncbi:MAG: helix-turn-helix transcriptional regulator [Chitinophagales bacterium]|nr:helix-turn-helix transcriptional regulator [Chitinophagales bacterium]